MAQNVEFTLDAKEAGAVRAWLAVERAAAQFNAGLGKIDQSQKDAEKSAAEWGAKARKLLADLETPQERHNRKLAEYSELRKRNLLDENQYAAAVRKSKVELDDSAKSGTLSLSALGGKIAGIATAYFSVGSAISAVMAANRKWIEEAEDAANRIDVSMRKVAVQGGLNAIQSKEAQKKIGDIAIETSVDPALAMAGSQQLISSGFSVEDATGPALRTLLQTAVASNVKDQDPTQSAQALGQFIEAMGLQKNAVNLDRVAIGTQRLFKGTDLQLSDLSQLAGKSQSFAGKQDTEEVMAAFDVLREKTKADTASTALKIFGDRLMGAKGDKERETQLQRVGLSPESVDLQGETITEVLDRIEAGMAKLPVEERPGFLQKMFGTEASSPIEGLIRDRGKIPKARALLSDKAGFLEDFRTGSSGRASGKVRLESEGRQLSAEQDQMGDLYLLAMQNEMKRSGFNAAQISTAGFIYSRSREFGYSPEESVSFSAPTARPTGAFTSETVDIAGAVSRAVAAAIGEANAPLKKAIEDNTKATVAANGANEKPNVTPPGPRPQQALDVRNKSIPVGGVP